ncbi:YdeI/OmpD-associated family protein [Geodermatophilus marinus]|uniref:YdeI/OmpD-associated family protein n=1 Tax=Geodermatophilus sp. LHW52908 TaxID=2303986 RepID=UPI000E3D33BF|nr:YdeI/OmpD-associated family protein [Geodermatophilus sp. LHW52908]RFU20182.1 hypothetical protein D0Z06_17900 [Geodermatophilus sp. LHW52908]
MITAEVGAEVAVGVAAEVAAEVAAAGSGGHPWTPARGTATITGVPVPDDLPVLAFPDQAAFEAWLEAEHATAPGLYVRIAKKGSGIASVTYPEVVESCLCFGWIDGRANSLDERAYLQRITPRRPRSVWSQKNVAAVGALTAAGRMRPAGLAAVEAARADGRWERAYAGPATATVPEDLAAALDAVPAARAAFDALDGTNRFAVLFRVQTAATAATRTRRIERLVTALAEGRPPA